MKNRSLFLFLAGLTVVLPTSAKANADTCSALQEQWVLIEQNLASNFADGITDNSAPRATNRGIEELNWNIRATLLYSLMKDNDCQLPKSLPSGNAYLSAALKCKTDMLGLRTGNLPASCERANWKPE